MSTVNITNTLRQLALTPVRLYQKIISPALPPSCRYAPTCSNYAIEAITTHGILKGTILATWRILRCNPWSNGGVDYVPEKGHWTPQPWEPPADWVGHGNGEWIPMGLPESLTSEDLARLNDTTPNTRNNDATPHTDLPARAGRPPKTHKSSTNVRSHECSN